MRAPPDCWADGPTSGSDMMHPLVPAAVGGAGVRTPVADTGPGSRPLVASQGFSPLASTTAALTRASLSMICPALNFSDGNFTLPAEDVYS